MPDFYCKSNLNIKRDNVNIFIKRESAIRQADAWQGVPAIKNLCELKRKRSRVLQCNTRFMRENEMRKLNRYKQENRIRH